MTIAPATTVQNIIYIYQDAGVSKPFFEQTANMIKTFADTSYALRGITAKQIKETEWEKTAALLIIPGGADLPYVRKLNGKGNARIKAFIENGGRILAICAGSYFCGAYVEFDKGGANEVLGERELALFPGKVIGPHLAPFCYETEKGTRAASITTYFDKKRCLQVFYNGGGYFENADENTVLARYSSQKAAIVKMKVGKGIAILSAIHFEVDFNLLDEKNLYLMSIIPALSADKKSRYLLIRQIFKELGVSHASHQTSR